MSALWTSDEAAAATQGFATAPFAASGIAIDTRALRRGDLFIALAGNRDGHDFAGAAHHAGASATMASRDVPGVGPLLMVPDTQKGLEDLGRAGRARTLARIVAVTGSAGKTTTKEMLRLMLAGEGKVCASAASFNNHWGVPLSLARMERDAAYGVFEIGMNHVGEIRALVAQVRPHVAIITTIAAAHLEYFSDLEAIADAKAEIFEGLAPGGAALIPADIPQAARLMDHARGAGVRILTFGRTGRDGVLLNVVNEDEGQRVRARIDREEVSFTIGAPGEHLAQNAVAALVAVGEMKASVQRCAALLGGFTALAGRGARLSVPVPGGEVRLIDESYNANPASMEAALKVLKESRTVGSGRRIAVLGDMLELGASSEDLHRAILSSLVGVDLVFLGGSMMRALWDALPGHQRGAYAQNAALLAPVVQDALKSGDVVLVKGSNGSRMSLVIDGLKRPMGK